METQDNIFARSEADGWFARNAEALHQFDPASDLPLKLIDAYDIKPRNVIEIGAANGFRVAEINRRCNARAVAVELSPGAIADGEARFPTVTFIKAAASAVPVQERFDLLIINFVFHWIDRALLFSAAAETDRLIADGGFLLIGDFLPANRVQKPYHHLPTADVKTFKQNYAELFLTSGLYHAVGLLTAHHASKTPDPRASEDERIGAWLLRKQLTRHYLSKGSNGSHE